MKNVITTMFLLLMCQWSIGQGVGIGTNAPNASAVLEVQSTTKGMLMPRMTTAQRDAIVSPSPGLQILNLDDYCLDIYDGTYWIKNCGFRITAIDTLPSAGWVQRQNFGGTARTGAVAFSIGNKGYIGTGSDGFGYQPDFWEFDPAANAWTQKASMGTGRSHAVGFSIGTLGYVGTGVNSAFLNDFWEFNPVANTWTQKAAFSGEARWLAVGFSMNGMGYLGSGQLENYNRTKDFWSYDPASDAWTAEADYPFYMRSGTAFTINNLGYVGTGLTSETSNGSVIASKDFYYYSGSDWIQVADLAGQGRTKAISFSASGKGYVGSGRNIFDAFLDDFWEYAPESNTWNQISTFSGAAREFAVGFSTGTKGYVGTGVHNAELYQDLWEYEPYPVANVYTATLPPAPVTSVDNGMWTRVDSNLFSSNAGLVGIGTSDPAHKLQVKTDNNAYGISHTNDSVDVATYVGNTIGGYIGTISQHPFSLYAGDGIHQLTLLPNGNVGVGKVPDNKLDVTHGSVRTDVHPTNRPLYITGDLAAASDGIEFRHSNGTQGIGFGFNTIYATGRHLDQDLGLSARGSAGVLFFKSNGLERMRVNGSGQVLIGTSNAASGHLLSVGGKIAAEEILVDLEADWPDYVFEKEYALPSMDELKAFIEQKGHLPGVPSAMDVKENGILLGEMNVVLLEKIEELTLYILAQEERIRNLESRIDRKP